MACWMLTAHTISAVSPALANLCHLSPLQSGPRQANKETCRGRSHPNRHGGNRSGGLPDFADIEPHVSVLLEGLDD